MKKIICKLFGHKRGKTQSRTPYIYYNQRSKYTRWFIECSRCGYKTSYENNTGSHARLVGQEIYLGFTGE
jgi:hypothetical protein